MCIRQEHHRRNNKLNFLTVSLKTRQNKKIMNIKSWIGKKVRIKPELILIEENEDELSGEISVSYSVKDGKALNSFVFHPESEVFYVLQDVWGADLFAHRRDEISVDELKPSHQLILRGGLLSSYPYLWDASYFEFTDLPETK